jgi:hypothetical protein
MLNAEIPHIIGDQRALVRDTGMSEMKEKTNRLQQQGTT